MKDILLDAFTKMLNPKVNVSLRRSFYKPERAALSDLDSYRHEEKLYNTISKIDELLSVICTD
jgi:hypothetical protein